MCETLAPFILSPIRPSEVQRKAIIGSMGMPNNTYSSEKGKHLGVLKIIFWMYTKYTEFQVPFLAFIRWGWKCNPSMTSFFWTGSSRSELVSSGVNQSKLVWTSLNQFESVWTGLSQFQPVSTSLNRFQQVWTGLNRSEPDSNGLNQLKPVQASLRQF